MEGEFKLMQCNKICDYVNLPQGFKQLVANWCTRPIKILKET